MSVNNMSNPVALFGMSWNWEIICKKDYSDDIKHLSDNLVVKYTSGELNFLTFNFPNFDENSKNSKILDIIEKEKEKGKIVMFYEVPTKDLENYKDYSLIRI